MSSIPMTHQGKLFLEQELHQLKSVERPKIIEAIATARALGDLKENAEYHSAREQQSFLEGRIGQIESKLSQVQVIDVSKIANNGKVIFGATVTLEHAEDAKQVKYQIVGEDEADIAKGKISIASPIARALIGKMVDDCVEVQIPSGEVSYDIIAVDYI